MRRKLAKKYLDTVLCNYLVTSVASARLQQAQIKSLLERGLSLIEKSEKKDHIFKEAGDMIFRFQDVVEDLNDSLALASYITSKLSLTDAAHDLKPPVREKIDEAAGSKKRGSLMGDRIAMRYMAEVTDIEELQGFPTFIQEIEKSEDVSPVEPEEESIYDIDNAEDRAKLPGDSIREDQINDYTDHNTYFTRPHYDPDTMVQ